MTEGLIHFNQIQALDTSQDVFLATKAALLSAGEKRANL